MGKFLIISEGGDGIGLAVRLQAEGHEARIWIRDSESEHRGEGIVEHAHDYEFGEIVVADCTGSGVLLDSFREHGGRTVGGSVVADKLESDREYATQVMQRAGIKVPHSRSFHDWNDAAEFIRESEAKLVFKPDGKCSGVIPSFCPSDNRELLESLDHFKTLLGASEAPEFTLQEFIEGVAVSTEGWFDGEKFIRPFNRTIERKHFLNDDLGPSGGCSGNVVWPVEDDVVVQNGILRMEDFLREVRYQGAIDLNCVVNEDGLYGLEFTPRFGYDAFPTLLYGLYTGDFGHFLYQLASGQGPDVMEVSNCYAAGVKVSLPPWPTEKYNSAAGVPIRGLSFHDLKTSFYPYEVSWKDSKFTTSGGYGIIGVMNAAGDTIDEAFARCYQKLSKLKLPDKQYRTDLAHQCIKDFNELALFTGDLSDDAWIGVDLDGTLAHYSGYKKHIGDPIPRMVTRVRRWITEGKQVKILTARVAPRDEQHEQQVLVHEWVKEHIGYPLEVTSHKDYRMQILWDDRVQAVEVNTGKRVA